MKSVPTSLKVFGIYLIVVPGLGLMIFPEFILDLFNLSHGGMTWLARIVGLLAFVIGVFEFLIAQHAIKELYKVTIVLRYFAAVFMSCIWLAGEVEVNILMFAAIDALGASWTLWALKNE